MNWTAPKAMIGIGGVGAVITALCCFTPVLVIALGGISTGTAIAYLDIVLLPLLGLFLLILVIGILRHIRCRTPGTE
ncbi:MAG: mercury resistance system transport protein MerF [Halofilum sp. (in: g-proteobacteria)]|nr:mercury resistance system transport protein MerF [Halofilum sp. (in: g-proteobacteria)]